MPVAFMISYQHLTATGTDNINCIKKAIQFHEENCNSKSDWNGYEYQT